MSVTLRTTPDDRNDKDQGDWKSLLTEMDQLKSMTPVPIAAGSPAQCEAARALPFHSCPRGQPCVVTYLGPWADQWDHYGLNPRSRSARSCFINKT
jgi:hypothetical protein